MLEKITHLGSVFCAWILFLVGGISIPFKALITLMIIDFITGIISAMKNKQLNSQTCFNGIIKKVSYLFVICVAGVVDILTIGNGSIRNMVLYFFIANDGISILENVSLIGINIPEKLKDMLEQLNNKESETDESN